VAGVPSTDDVAPDGNIAGTRGTSFQVPLDFSGVGERFGALAATSPSLSSTRFVL
jgi:hypothetical protein